MTLRPHVALLGDSIFDNASYTAGGPAVVDHLKSRLAGEWEVTLAAVDGATVENIPGQIERRLPADATHLVVSIGGNDALSSAGFVRYGQAESVAEALTALERIRSTFRRAYREMVQRLLTLEKPVIVCTIYDAIPGLEPAESAGLCLFNDVILREAFQARLDVIDFRLVCTQPGDYSAVSPIEPSVQGGGKIAEAIVRALELQTSPRSVRGSQVVV